MENSLMLSILNSSSMRGFAFPGILMRLNVGFEQGFAPCM
jgi:hypothetical protein